MWPQASKKSGKTKAKPKQEVMWQCRPGIPAGRSSLEPAWATQDLCSLRKVGATPERKVTRVSNESMDHTQKEKVIRSLPVYVITVLIKTF